MGAAGSAPHRARLDASTALLAPLELLETGDFLPPTCAQRYRTCVVQLAELYEAWSRDVPVHRIHGDCHVGNLLRGDEGWFFLDFDDFVVGPAVHDVWMLLPGRDSEGVRQRRRLVEAYRQLRDFPESQLRLVEPLRAFRFVFYAAWIARRWEDAAFPSAFPHFGTAEYWENETRDLEEHLDRLLTGDEDVPAGLRRDEEVRDVALSDKDYFWDL